MSALQIPVFGPSREAAQLESSKAFAKSFMDRHEIPTGGWSEHTNKESALAAVQGPCVVKADGLAAGKGVVVAPDAATARAAIEEIFGGRFGEAGSRVIVEELLIGPEVSVLALCDGSHAVPLLPCRDHKRRFDGDEGPNTGGMGAVCPAPGVSEAQLEVIRQEVLQRAVDGMASEGIPFRGVLYAGIMLTDSGPKVLEFNVRFGDPECQPLMTMLDTDLVPFLLAAASGNLGGMVPSWHSGAACCVVMVAGDYPGTVQKGMPISGVPLEEPGLVTFFAGARREEETVLAWGGRVLGVTARGEDLESARKRAYSVIEQIDFETGAYRRDIGAT